MDRRMRRLSQKIRRNIRDVKSATTNLFSRSYSYSGSSYRSTVTPSTNSDDEDHYVFGSTAMTSSITEETRRGSVTLIPCEFCQTQQSDDALERHQLQCSQNPANVGRRRHLTASATNPPSRRRVTSETVSSPPPVPARHRTPTPTAPHRSRSPSPTDGYTAPNHLLCPIQMTVFHDPVVASDGHTYERSAIENWLQANHTSPVTRQSISRNRLNPNLSIKQLADEFREECKQRRARYKYRLDIDIKKTDPIEHLNTPKKTFYHVEWMKNNTYLSNSDVVLVELIGDQAEKYAEINCRLGIHPNIVRTFGRVEHSKSDILLLQESLSEQTLSDLIQTKTDEKLSVAVIDTIIYQTAVALQYLALEGIVHGNISMKNIYVYQFDQIPENILIKLTNISEENNDDQNQETDIFAFGLLVQELYSNSTILNEEDLREREDFIQQCLNEDPHQRPTFVNLTKMIIDLINNRRFIFPCSV